MTVLQKENNAVKKSFEDKKRDFLFCSVWTQKNYIQCSGGTAEEAELEPLFNYVEISLQKRVELWQLRKFFSDCGMQLPFAFSRLHCHHNLRRLVRKEASSFVPAELLRSTWESIAVVLDLFTFSVPRYVIKTGQFTVFSCLDTFGCGDKIRCVQHLKFFIIFKIRRKWVDSEKRLKWVRSCCS